MKKNKTALIVFLLLFSLFVGCVEEQDKSSDDIDLRVARLTDDDLKMGLQMINGSENYTTQPYTVESGKMFEGNTVLKKYEVLFLKNTSVFLTQQIAQLPSVDEASAFVETLKSSGSIPGMVSDWQFSNVAIDMIGDDVVLKQNTTMLEGQTITIYLLVFHVDEVVSIFAAGSIPQQDLIGYADLVEQRLQQL